PPDGATFAGALIGEPTDLWLVANDLGYGFVVKLAELITRNRSGKAVLKLKPGAKVNVPSPIKDLKTDQLVAVSNEGHILVFGIKNLPELARGKGNKIMGINTKKHAAREEFMSAITCVPAGENLIVVCGSRHMTLTPKELAEYKGDRGRKGLKLPKNYRSVDALYPESRWPGRAK
ncbi:MAG TPA: DNA gyrase C-terminal beta-propeller domain-containing protein, partial [Gammaproteobacteria bacterium]|nr:DNA gyrase C-terminal beta-propeller domain-containing protein [Gammaproteobacteria bacterium]